MKYCILLFSFLFATAVYAKTIVISDIDDTLKNSHVLNTGDMVRNSVFTNDQFLGMNWLYNQLSLSNPEMRFFYVSTAPQQLMQEFHADFIRGNHFAPGIILLKKDFFSADFKLVTIRKILKQETPDQVIAVGDNGEKDTLVYAQLKKEFPHIVFSTFIHVAYSTLSMVEAGKSMEEGQTGFATSLDLLLHFYNLNLIPQNYLAGFLHTFAKVYFSQLNGDVRLAIPSWMDCRDFKWSVNDSVFDNDAVFAQAKQRIIQRCSEDSFYND